MAGAASAETHCRPRQLVVALLAVTFSLVLVFGTVLVLHEYVISMSRVKSLVNINGEANLPAWWNSVLLLMIGIGARGSAGRSWRPGSGSRPSPGWFRASSSRLRCSSCWSPSDGVFRSRHGEDC